MRVAILSGAAYPCPPRGYGSEVAAYLLARELCLMGHEAHLFGPGGSLHPGPGGHLHSIRGSYGAPSFHDADAWRWYPEVLSGCEVVHDLSPTCRVCEELFLEGRTNYLYTRNGIDFRCPRFGRRNAVVLSRAARRAATLGESAWHGTCEEGGPLDAPPGRLAWSRVVHYGTAVGEGDPCGYWPRVGEPDGYLLYLGRPHPAKGVGRILALARAMPERRFVLAWRPAAPDHREFDVAYRRQADGLGNVAFVTLPPGRDEHMGAKRRLLQGAQALLTLPMYTEAFGLTTIEALACGTPVISTDRGAAPEILRHGETGWLVPAGEGIDEVRRAVAALHEIDRAACRADALGRWTARRMAEDYLELYAEVAAGRGLDPADRLAWQRRAVERTVGRVLNAGCKEDPAGLKRDFGDRVVNLDRAEVDEDALRAGEGPVPIATDVRHDLLDVPWPFADRSFELVLLGDVLEDLPPGSQARVLREAARVGTRLCVTCPEDDAARDPHHLTRIDAAQLCAWAAEAGWRPTDVQPVTYAFGAPEEPVFLRGTFLLAERAA